MRRRLWGEALGLALLVLVLGANRVGAALPTAADREQSQAIARYWTEVLAYPLKPEAALTSHWGDLTAFWYFQHGEGLRPDLWAIFPPEAGLIDAWLEQSGRPLWPGYSSAGAPSWPGTTT